MKPCSAIAKGKELEIWVAERLQKSGLDQRAYPQRGSGSGKNKGDIWNSLDLHFECKNQKAIHWSVWKEQVKSENVSHLREVIVWKPPREPIEGSVVIIDWDYFEELLIGNKGVKPVRESPNLKWPLQRLKDAINGVLKELE